MRQTTTFLPAFVLGVTGAILGATSALAFPITYTEQATASGCLGGTTQADCTANHGFTNATMLLTMSNDTGSVTGSGPVFDNIGTLTLSVTGFAAATFTDTAQAVANQTATAAGFVDVTNSHTILATVNSQLSTYDLKSSIGPLSGNGICNTGTSFGTSAGLFILTNTCPTPPAGSFTSVFSATVPVPAPEPSTLASVALLVVGLAGLELIRRRSTF